jgi:hypothetical protein
VKKNQFSNIKKSVFLLLYCLNGFLTFGLVAIAGEAISVSLGFDRNFNFEIIHLQIALLGAILYGGIYFFKSRKPV